MSRLSLVRILSNLKSVALTVFELLAFNSHDRPLRAHKQTDTSNERIISAIHFGDKYVTDQTTTGWKGQKNAGEQWVEIFDYFEQMNIKCDGSFDIVQFVLALLGTCFSLINNLWTKDTAVTST